MNQENNNLNSVLPSFSFSIKEYLEIFAINSLLTLNNFINTRLNSSNKISPTTVYRIFIYGMFEYQKNIINSPEITINIITKVVNFIKKNKDVVDKIYKLILSAKDLDDFEKIQQILEK
jgi:hypothetical protein